VHARPHVDAVAGVEAHALGRDAAQRVIDRLDASSRPRPAFLHAEAGIHHVVRHQARVVDLEHEARVDDCSVLLVERVGQGLLVLLVGLVEAVGQRGEDVGRRDGRQEHLLVGPALHRDSQIVDIGLHCRLAPVGDRPRADVDAELACVAASAEALRDAIGPRVIVGEVQVLAAGGAGAALLPWRRRLALEADKALHDVAEEARLALLAVGDDVDTGLGLPPNDVVHGFAHQPGVSVAIVWLPAVLRFQDRDEGVGSRQAADVGREDALRAPLHHRLTGPLFAVCEATTRRCATTWRELDYRPLAEGGPSPCRSTNEKPFASITTRSVPAFPCCSSRAAGSPHRSSLGSPPRPSSRWSGTRTTSAASAPTCATPPGASRAAPWKSTGPGTPTPTISSG